MPEGILSARLCSQTRRADQVMNDKADDRPKRAQRYGRPDDGLGPNTDIGAKLRALYGAVQEEGIPDKLLTLLESLDQAERKLGQSRQKE